MMEARAQLDIAGSTRYPQVQQATVELLCAIAAILATIQRRASF